MVYPTRNKSLNVLHNYSHSTNCFHLFLFLFFFHLHHKLCLCLYMVFKIMTLILEYFFHVLYVLLKKHKQYVYVYVFVVIIWQSAMSFFLSMDFFFNHSFVFINFQRWHSWEHMNIFFFVFVICQYIACLKSFAKSNSTSIVLAYLFTHKKLHGTPLPKTQYNWNGILINFICISKSSSENELFSPFQYLYLLGC